MIEIEKVAENLFDKIRSRFDAVNIGDENAKATLDPTQARFFNFDYVINDRNLGNITISLVDSNNLKVFFDKDIDSEMSPEENKLAKNFIGKYQYTRVGLDSRELELCDNGVIGIGKANCERRWSLTIIDNIPNIVVIGSSHKGSEIATFFAKDSGDSINFSGNWTVFEKCPITMQRL